MKKQSLRRRGFFQAALATTAAGVCSAATDKPDGKAYRESLETPIVARHQVAVHHEVDYVMHDADHQCLTVLREERHLDEHREGQGFLAAHEYDRLPASRSEVKETGH